MIIQQNDNSDFDYDFGPAEIVLSTEGYFHPMELESIDVLQQILSGTIEMKHHDYMMTTGNLLIEYEIDKHNTGNFEPSGLSVTKAKYYFFNIGTAGLFATVDSIKWMCRNYKKHKIQKLLNNDKTQGYVGRNFRIPISQFITLLAHYQVLELGIPLKYGKIDEFDYLNNLEL